MHKKYKRIAQCIIALAVGWVGYMPYRAKAAPSYTLNTITITATAAIAPIVRYPYLRLLKWLTPTTDASLIYRYITLKPGATFDLHTLSAIQKRLMALPYFSTVSITRKGIDGANETTTSDVIITTKDKFPITVDVSLNEGPLLTITHHNAWGYGHSFSHQLFLKKRWGYGWSYELPRLNGNCSFGGQYYNQMGAAHGNTYGAAYDEIYDSACNGAYRFNYQNLWIAKLFAIQPQEPFAPYYWITGLSGSKKQFTVSNMEKTAYQDYTFVLGKAGWVMDDYATIRGVYNLHTLETLPKGGSIEMLYGYQNGAFKNRHYIGIHCIKNIANPTLRYLHLSCASGAFLYKKALEEAILKLTLAYAGPPIQIYNGARQFIAINYIVGYRMAKERMLAIRPRDPEALEVPDKDNRMQAPIHARLNVELDSTLHMPIMVKAIRFVCLSFAHFIALYSQDNALLNETWVDRYGIGLQLEHVTIPWLAGTFKIGYSPFLGKVVPSVQLAIGHFKNKTDPKPTVIAYN